MGMEEAEGVETLQKRRCCEQRRAMSLRLTRMRLVVSNVGASAMAGMDMF